MKRVKTNQAQADKRMFIFSLVFFVGTCLLVFYVISSRGRSAAVYSTATPSQMMTLEPAVLSNLTNVPPTLSGRLRTQLDDLEQMVESCPDYSDARRSQMQQHLAWLHDPSQIPRDLIIAFGSEPSVQLVFGMSTYTAIEWRMQGRETTSCLYEIGRVLNEMLIEMGQTPAEEFSG